MKPRLVVRALLYLFKQVKFPVGGAEIDIDKPAPAIERALAPIQQDIALFENDGPLVASRASGRLSLPSDRPFESYEQAAGHVFEPLERGPPIYADQGYVDARTTRPISLPVSEFSIRTAAAPELGDALKLALRHMPPGANGRAMVKGRAQCRRQAPADRTGRRAVIATKGCGGLVLHIPQSVAARLSQ